MKTYITLALAMTATLLFAQAKKVLDHPDFAIWNQISQEQISNDGKWISYEITPGEGDPTLVVYEVETGHERRYPRGRRAHFSYGDQYLVFQLSPPDDSVKALKRRRVENDALPTDTLAILHLVSGRIDRVPDLEKFTMPEEWSGYVMYQLKPAASEKDEKGEKSEKDEKGEKKSKKPSEKNGYKLIVRNLENKSEDTLAFVKEYAIAKESPALAAISTGIDSLMSPGVYTYRFDLGRWFVVKKQEGEYKHLALSADGIHLAFLGDIDTTEIQVRPYALYHWRPGIDSAMVAADNNSQFLDKGWIISEYYKPAYAKDGSKLHFGIMPVPMVEDTTILDDEKVVVEVWHYEDPVLYTQQTVNVKSEKERSYHCILDLTSGNIRPVANAHLRDSKMDPEKNSPYIILTDDRPYRKESSWTGDYLKDVWVFDTKTGRHIEIARAADGSPNLSPDFNYLYWYEAPDSVWYVSPVGGEPMAVSGGIATWDEENDRPVHANSYGIGGWLKGDAGLLVYDRYDIWLIDLLGSDAPTRLTQGRESRIQYRCIDLDSEEKFIDPHKKLLLYLFDERTRYSGYAALDLRTGDLSRILLDPLMYQRSPLKAKDADVLVYTAESFQKFPDLHVTTNWFESRTQISDVNPQQKEYNWGTAELFKWKAYDGREVEGVLIKPENFEPEKKYPMIVNFYERSSENLFRHRTPFPHRSTINYAFYASRGYVIFNPDVWYDNGYPGEGGYNCAVSGTEAVLKLGFVDPQRVGIQGHSWGGYQIAHILTKTGIYKCAEAGAPVVNMVSAYGGIRWATGLSRMFLYEHFQSRIGASLWERPDLYLENSPIFNIDKISTPVLILQNDHDGHVPWYQGIEWFVAMRRLNKPAWMLNYPGEPHWPLKLQLRKDLNIRMQQFFDHYLKDAPKPMWMERGLPAIEKGIEQGYELMTDD